MKITNDGLQSGNLYNLISVFKVINVNLLTTGQTTIVTSVVGKRFTPVGTPLIIIRSITGIILISPIIRIGTSGSYDNISPLLTVTPAALNNVVPVLLNTTINTIDISSNDIKIDVQTGGTGATILTADIIIFGIYE